MIAVSPEEHDRLLRIDENLVSELRVMHEGGSTPAEMIHFLAGKGLPKPGATNALRRAKVMTGNEAKAAVHLSPEYAYRREADEAFYEAAATLAEQDNQEATAA